MVLPVNQFLPLIQPLAVTALGIIFYSIFVFKFYRSLSRKDIFSLNLQQYKLVRFEILKKVMSVFLYVVEYLVLFPLYTFFWFAVLSFFIFVLSRNPNIGDILLLAMAIVIATRITAYYNEDLSRDLAKILPFALLAIYIIDPAFLSLQETIIRVKGIVQLLETVVIYGVFTVLLELIIRLPYSLILLITKQKIGEEKTE